MRAYLFQLSFIIVLAFCLSESELFAQGMSRSTGLGFRFGF